MAVFISRVRTAANARLLTHRSAGELRRPFSEGTMRYVARGHYVSGPRRGQLCVVKWLKSGMTSSRSRFRHDMSVVTATLSITERWNAARVIDQPIRVNMPAVWRLSPDLGSFAGIRVLVEPYIDRFEKWNSNTGWSDTSTAWGRVMQALSHFSYHTSGGRMLLCDLQGGTYESCAVLTDPVVCSLAEAYGPTDMGANGINAFFQLHMCNEYCKPEWRCPPRTRTRFTATMSTSRRRD